MTLTYKYALEAVTDDAKEQNDLVFRGELHLKIVDLLENMPPEECLNVNERLEAKDFATLDSLMKGKLDKLSNQTLVEFASLLGYRVLPTLEKIETLS